MKTVKKSPTVIIAYECSKCGKLVSDKVFIVQSAPSKVSYFCSKCCKICKT